MQVRNRRIKATLGKGTMIIDRQFSIGSTACILPWVDKTKIQLTYLSLKQSNALATISAGSASTMPVPVPVWGTPPIVPVPVPVWGTPPIVPVPVWGTPPIIPVPVWGTSSPSSAFPVKDQQIKVNAPELKSLISQDYLFVICHIPRLQQNIETPTRTADKTQSLNVIAYFAIIEDGRQHSL